jgi:hypothetical protein
MLTLLYSGSADNPTTLQRTIVICLLTEKVYNHLSDSNRNITLVTKFFFGYSKIDIKAEHENLLTK